LHHHYAACLKTIHKTEAFVMDHRLTVPELKLCGKDIKVNPFLILCDTFRQKDSLVEINDGEKCLVDILLFPQQHWQLLEYVFWLSVDVFQSAETISQDDLNTPEIIYNQPQLVQTEIFANNAAPNGTTHRWRPLRKQLSVVNAFCSVE
jgi:hypothetical protein